MHCPSTDPSQDAGDVVDTEGVEGGAAAPPVTVLTEPAYVALAGANDTLPYASVSRRSQPLLKRSESEPPPSMGYLRPTKGSTRLISREDPDPVDLAFDKLVSAPTNRAWPLMRVVSRSTDATPRPTDGAQRSSNESVPPATTMSATGVADLPASAPTKGSLTKLGRRRSGGLILLGALLAIITATLLRTTRQEADIDASGRPAAGSAEHVKVLRKQAGRRALQRF